MKNWYEKALDGADINFGLKLLDEIHRTYLPLRLLNLRVQETTYNCTLKTCQITLELEPGAIVTQPEVSFFGNNYQPSFPIKKGKNKSDKKSILLYNNLVVKSEKSPLLNAYKKGKPLTLYSCNDIVSYIKTYNSILAREKGKSAGGEIVFKSLPASSIGEKAKRLSGQVKSYDMLSADWSMEIKGGDANLGEINAQMALYKQAYREAFLIRKIETIKSGIKVSGGLVCKA